MSWGTTVVQCMICKKQHQFYGWLPTADMIWYQNEGLECCDQQTHIVAQAEKLMK